MPDLVVPRVFRVIQITVGLVVAEKGVTLQQNVSESLGTVAIVQCITIHCVVDSNIYINTWFYLVMLVYGTCAINRFLLSSVIEDGQQ